VSKNRGAVRKFVAKNSRAGNIIVQKSVTLVNVAIVHSVFPEVAIVESKSIQLQAVTSPRLTLAEIHALSNFHVVINVSLDVTKVIAVLAWRKVKRNVVAEIPPKLSRAPKNICAKPNAIKWRNAKSTLANPAVVLNASHAMSFAEKHCPVDVTSAQPFVTLEIVIHAVRNRK
jgi:hypothetical protein